MDIRKNGLFCGREVEWFHHGTDPEWGYEKDQEDTFALVHPKNEKEGVAYPLYVVFHSAGHYVYTALLCTSDKGNHDIYHTPDESFALFLDCFVNRDSDWWWGGIAATGELADKNGGIEPRPAEKRCIDTVLWVRDNYSIDKERVYAVGNSMGGSGSLGVCLCRGDIFAVIKANVPAGVLHANERCCLEKEAPEGFSIPDPPIVVDYSAQNDMWSMGHDILYRGMEKKRYALMGFWGCFGHENDNEKIYAVNDLVHSFDISTVRKDEAYPVFTSASSDDAYPWQFDPMPETAGQVNAFFRWDVICDTEDELSLALYMITNDTWTTRVTIPASATANVTVRRAQNFKAEKFTATYGGAPVDPFVFDGKPAADGLTITAEKTILTFKKVK